MSWALRTRSRRSRVSAANTAAFPEIAGPAQPAFVASRAVAHNLSWSREWRALSTPDRLLFGVCLLLIAFAASQLLLFSFGRDQSIYAVVGHGVLSGEMPYRDLWDFKPPGIFLLYAGAEALFGKQMWAPRLLEVLGLLGCAGVLCFIGRTLVGSALTGLVAAALAALFHVQLEFWHTGQPETFGGFLTVLGLALTVYRPVSRLTQLLLWCLIGTVFSFAFLLKPPLAGVLVVCVAHLWQRELQRHSPVGDRLVFGGSVLIGFAVPLLGCVLWFVQRDAWPELRWTLFEFAPGYTKLGWQGHSALGLFVHGLQESILRFSPLVPLGLLALAFPGALHSREHEALFLTCGAVSVQVAGIALQAKFFQYHYAATLPLLALVSAIGLFKVWRRARHSWAAVIAMFAVCGYLVTLRSGVRDLPGTFWQRSKTRLSYLLGPRDEAARHELDRTLYYVADFNLAADHELARTLLASTASPSSSRLFVWGFEPAIYYFSGLTPASRYIYNVPQRASWQGERARADLLRELEVPPEFIVVQHHDVFSFVTGNELDSARALATFPELAALLASRYAKETTLEDFDVYRLQASP